MSVKKEKYSSKAAMMKHEKTESPAMRKKEYGSTKGGLFNKTATTKKSSMKKMRKKK